MSIATWLDPRKEIEIGKIIDPVAQLEPNFHC